MRALSVARLHRDDIYLYSVAAARLKQLKQHIYKLHRRGDSKCKIMPVPIRGAPPALSKTNKPPRAFLTYSRRHTKKNAFQSTEIKLVETKQNEVN